MRGYLSTCCALLFPLGGLLGGLLGGCESAGEEPGCATDGDCPTGFACVDTGCYQRLGERCADADGDGFSTGPGCSGDMIDCDDTDAARYPGAPEVCGDGINQDCLSGADLGCECAGDVGVGTTRDCNQGRCAGVQTCTDTGWGECLPGTSPRPERCGDDGMGDSIDDDCNGVADDGCVSCGGRPDGSGTENVCFDDGGDPAFCSSNGNCF